MIKQHKPSFLSLGNLTTQRFSRQGDFLGSRLAIFSAEFKVFEVRVSRVFVATWCQTRSNVAPK